MGTINEMQVANATIANNIGYFVWREMLGLFPRLQYKCVGVAIHK